MTVEGPSGQPESQNLYYEMLNRAGEQHRLLSVHWELTYRCNEHCSHCYLDVLPPGAEPNELTTEECCRIIDELAALGVLNVTLSGGEILVRRDFFEIAEYAYSKRFLLRFFTNGIAVTPKVADKIAALHPYAVEISLYSTCAQVHERITGRRHSHELTMSALRLLYERGVRTVMKTPMMHENVYEIHDLEAFAHDLGAQFRYDITLTPKDSGDRAPFAHRMTDEDMLWLFREMLDPPAWLDRKVRQDDRTCDIGRIALLIDPVGNVHPCVQLRSRVGNVRTQTIQQIWEGSPQWTELNELTINRLTVCRDCHLRDLCVRCHGLASVEDGDVWGSASERCREARLRRQVFMEKRALNEQEPVQANVKHVTLTV